jgi:hypothetical protein
MEGKGRHVRFAIFYFPFSNFSLCCQAGISCRDSAGYKIRAVRWDQHHDPAPRRIRAMNPAALRPRGADKGQESGDASTRLCADSTLGRNCATPYFSRLERMPIVCFERFNDDSNNWILRLENCMWQVRGGRWAVKLAPWVMLCWSPVALHAAVYTSRVSFGAAQTLRRAHPFKHNGRKDRVVANGTEKVRGPLTRPGLCGRARIVSKLATICLECAMKDCEDMDLTPNNS